MTDMPSDTAVVLASGGMDSAVTMAIAKQDYQLALLHLNYGQRTQGREQEAFFALAEHFKVEKTLVVDGTNDRKNSWQSCDFDD